MQGALWDSVAITCQGQRQRESAMNEKTSVPRVALPAAHEHPTFARTLARGRLTLGFILPLEGYPDLPIPTLEQHAELAAQADRAGFAALWTRDIAVLDPGFGDAGQLLDPFVYLGFLASRTHRIALGTASTVLTMRHPIHVAKQAASVDFLSAGRVILGVATGDRAIEYSVFGIGSDYETRGERFREAFTMFRAVTEHAFPVVSTQRFGEMCGDVDVLPKPLSGRIPLLVTGLSRQDMDWIATHGDGWLYYNLDLVRLSALLPQWRAAVQRNHGADAFRPFAQGFFFELDANPDAVLTERGPYLRGGRKAALRHFEAMERLGVSHVALNMKSNRRPVSDVMDELAEFILPRFATPS
jgi:luciferase-type oxidoreductase